MSNKADIAVVGLAVMGQNLILNMSDHNVSVVVFNRTVSKVDTFLAGAAKEHSNISGAHSVKELVDNLKSPRKIMLMVRAGDAVDGFINELLPYLDSGDIIIDGGNSNFTDTERRVEELRSKGIKYVGTGVSGGEEGARFGPSIMPGGDSSAWEDLKPIFQGISAKTESGEPCCDWVGNSGSGHFVKMVHNGIEYGDMQLIAEVYDIMKRGFRLSNGDMGQIFEEWNKGFLESYLVEITADIFTKKDGDQFVVDQILDKAGQKGTGKWTVINGADAGVPLTLISEAVFARSLSSLLDQREKMAKLYPNTSPQKLVSKISTFDLERALFVAKIISYTQGFMLIDQVSEDKKWNIDSGSVALMWRGGCIIRSSFLGEISSAYRENPNLDSLLEAPYFIEIIREFIPSLRRVVAASVEAEIPIAALSSALAFFDGYRSKQLPANLIQAQRDYFGAHTYERVDKNSGEFFHTNWTTGGAGVSSSTYDA
jgi:6-phosphogluconate dehydrogenase